MGIATLEDLQGTLEVVVFPRLYSRRPARGPQARSLLVAGRIDHSGEEYRFSPISSPTGTAPPPSARRRLPARSQPAIAAGARRSPTARAAPAARPGSGTGTAIPVLRRRCRSIPSPLLLPRRPAPSRRGRSCRSFPRCARRKPGPGAPPAAERPAAIRPGGPIPAYSEPPGLELAVSDHDDEETPLPEEMRVRAADLAAAPTSPLDAGPGRSSTSGLDGRRRRSRRAGHRDVGSLIRERPGPRLSCFTCRGARRRRAADGAAHESRLRRRPPRRGQPRLEGDLVELLLA